MASTDLDGALEAISQLVDERNALVRQRALLEAERDSALALVPALGALLREVVATWVPAAPPRRTLRSANAAT